VGAAAYGGALGGAAYGGGAAFGGGTAFGGGAAFGGDAGGSVTGALDAPSFGCIRRPQFGHMTRSLAT
jgi:hypothetical protein